MDILVRRPKGTQDVLPDESIKWQTVEKIAEETAEQFGFREIRFPTFEETGLFKRSVGDTTDVVQKEMYSVSARSPQGKEEQSFTLRPEGTAGTVRAVLENGLLNNALPLKAYYIISCFRHEKQQKGRYREFHQFGAEMFGSASPAADAEMIAMVSSLMNRLGLSGIVLNINSIGCPTCRAKYQQALRDYFGQFKDKLCPTCLERLEKNPMRLLDCKSEICSEIGKNAPIILDYICEDCSSHFEKLKELLTLMDIEFTVNPKIVRGLDYYTKTVFEFVSSSIGAQGTVCGGGRYDGLVEQLGGNPTPALGFAMGLERLILTMESQGLDFMEEQTCDLYIAAMGDAAEKECVRITKLLRDEGFRIETDLMNRGLKAQMKYADKINAKFSVVIGDNELDAGSAEFKNMKTGEKVRLSLTKELKAAFSDLVVRNMFDDDTIDNILN